MLSANQILIEAKQGKAKELKELLNSLVELSLEASGCQKFELYQLNDLREQFFIIELFKSEKKHMAYLEDESYKELKAQIDSLAESISVNALKLPQCLTKLGLKKTSGDAL